MDWLAGLTPASPMPTPMRSSNSIKKPTASPLNAVIRENTASEATMMSLRLPRSAARAMGMPKVA